jgi:hypothetical protein
MNDFMWFRPIVRLTGAVILAWAVPQATIGVVMLVINSLRAVDGSVQSQDLLYFVMSTGANSLPAIGIAALGAYLLFGGRAFVRWCLRDLGSFCPACGYDIRGLASARCPECNGVLPPRNDRTTQSAAGGTPGAHAATPVSSSTPPLTPER